MDCYHVLFHGRLGLKILHSLCIKFAMALVGRLRTRPHGPEDQGNPQLPLPVPPGTDVEIFPCARGASEAVMFLVLDRAFRLLTFDVSGEMVDYTMLCVSRSWWRAVSRWREL